MEGKEEGISEGIQQGIEKGIEQGIEKVAIEMIRDGETNDKIRKYSGLTDDEIEGLRVPQ